MTNPRTALTALITEHSGLTGVRAGRLAEKIAAEWLPAQGGTPTVDPAALVEKVTVALAQWGICYGKADAIDPIARAVIAAVWPIVTDAADVRRQTADDIAAAQYAEADRLTADHGEHVRVQTWRDAARIAREVGGDRG